MVKGGTGFRKQASKRRRTICRKKLHLAKKGSNHLVSSEFDEIADNNIVDINLNIVVGGSTKTIIIWFGNQSRGSFQYSCKWKKAEGSFTGYRLLGMDIQIISFMLLLDARSGNKLKLLQTKKLCMYFEMALVCLNTSKKKKKFRSFDLNLNTWALHGQK